MNRQEIYFIDDKEVSKDEWFKELDNPNNLHTLTVKYKKEDTIESLRETIDRLEKEIDGLKNKNDINDWYKKIVKDPYPNISYPNTWKPDWTWRPETAPLYVFTTTSATPV